MKGKLYLVATPIGNLEDITIRAIKILERVDLIAAEDTRHTLKLLNHLNIKKPLISYYKQTENEKTQLIIQRLLKGENIALVSDAGTPAISDPGEIIVKECINQNIDIVPIPGACAAINALIASGLNTKNFYFEGFLPVNKKEKIEILEKIKNLENTIIFYEAPHKLIKTLQVMQEVLGNRSIVLAKEITKIHEQYIRGTISEVLEVCTEPKGEFVIIAEGAEEKHIKEIFENMTLEEHYEFYKQKGLDKKEIIKKIAKDKNTNKNEIYQYFLK